MSPLARTLLLWALSLYGALSLEDLVPIPGVKDSPLASFLPAVCGPNDSCKGRCGREFSGDPFLCQCDGLCTFYGDCCLDYRSTCRPARSKVRSHALRCLHLKDMGINAYVVTRCKDSQPCQDPLSPVLSQRGVLYANPRCLACNGARPKSPSNITRDIRPCFIMTDSCPVSARDRRLEELCYSHNSPIISLPRSSIRHRDTVPYKNVYCALCNGSPLAEISCPKYFLKKEGINENGVYFKQIYLGPTSDLPRVKGTYDKDLPASFSILLNFGLDGKEKMMISSQTGRELLEKQRYCGDTHIWNPFSKSCRKMYCSTNFVLVNFNCVESDEGLAENTTEFLESQSRSVHLTLTLDASEILRQDERSEREFKKEMSVLALVPMDLIEDLNITFLGVRDGNSSEDRGGVASEDSGFLHRAEFDLVSREEGQASLQDIVSRMIFLLGWDTFELEVGAARVRVVDIAQQWKVKERWCVGGRTADYWNQEYSLVLNGEENGTDWIREVFINGTGRTYGPGYFIANILFQGYNDNRDLLNVSGVVRVCDLPARLERSCTRIELAPEEFSLTDNLTLNYTGGMSHMLDLSAFEPNPDNGSVFVCTKTGFLNALIFKFPFSSMDDIQSYLTLVFTVASVVALALVLVTYLLFKKLRNVPGCNVMNLTVTLLAMQVTFLVTQRMSVTGALCVAGGAVFHYLILCSFCWMAVMAYDLNQTFGQGTRSALRDKKAMVWKYVLWGYASPVLVVGPACLMDHLRLPLAPRYGQVLGSCWIGDKSGALLFFALPLALILSLNLVLYVATIRSLVLLKRNVKDSRHSKRGQTNLIVYIKMAAVLGFTWAFAFAAAWIPGSKSFKDVLNIFYIVFNTLQGVMVFSAFICNKQVFQLYRELCQGVREMQWKNVCQLLTARKRQISSQASLTSTSVTTP